MRKMERCEMWHFFMEIRFPFVPLLSTPVLRSNPLSALSSCRVYCVREVGFDELSSRVSGWMVKRYFWAPWDWPSVTYIAPLPLEAHVHCVICCIYSSVRVLWDIWLRTFLRYLIVILLIFRGDSYMIGTLVVFGMSLIWFSVLRSATSQSERPSFTFIIYIQYIVTVLCIFMVTSLNTIRQMIKKFRGFSPQANYTDRAIAECRRS
jgi:hypothetical protein